VEEAKNRLHGGLVKKGSGDGGSGSSLERSLVVDGDEDRVGAEDFEMSRDGVDDTFNVAAVESFLNCGKQLGEVPTSTEEVVRDEAVHDFTNGDGTNLVGRRAVRYRQGRGAFVDGDETRG
jgi:hypothetical protein